MARAGAAQCGGAASKVNWAYRRAQFEKETKPELEKQLNALINKIGLVNVIALLDAINAMTITDIDTPYRDKDYRNNWFALQVEDEEETISGIEVLVDDKLEWQERWCAIRGKIDFGSK